MHDNDTRTAPSGDGRGIVFPTEHRGGEEERPAFATHIPSVDRDGRRRDGDVTATHRIHAAEFVVATPTSRTADSHPTRTAQCRGDGREAISACQRTTATVARASQVPI